MKQVKWSIKYITKIPINKLCDCKYCPFEFPKVSDSKYSSSVMSRKRQANEMHADHLENNAESAMARRTHENYYRHSDITASNEWRMRHSYSVNNWRRRKQFYRYVRISIYIYTNFAFTHTQRHNSFYCVLNHSTVEVLINLWWCIWKRKTKVWLNCCFATSYENSFWKFFVLFFK